MANKPKKKVSNIMLVIICIMIICYAVANFVLQYYTQIEVSPTLTTSWFAFWGVELVSLTAIKTSKIKHKQDDDSVAAEEETESVVEFEETEKIEEPENSEETEKSDEKTANICFNIYYPFTKDEE